MKKTFTFLCFFYSIGYSHAQIVLDQSDFPGVGWEIQQMEAYDHEGNVNFDDLVDYGTSGPSGSYDISDIMPYVVESHQMNFVSTHTNDWQLHHPDAVVMLADTDPDVDEDSGDTLALGFNFYGFDGNHYSLLGKTFVIDPEGLFEGNPSGEFDTIHIPFNHPSIIASTDYVLGFNTVDSSFWEVSIDNFYHSETLIREIFVDGWGDLNTPDGTIPVLRVKVTERESYLNEFDGEIENEETDTSYYYEFWAKATGFPIAKIDVDEDFEYAYSVEYAYVSNAPVSTEEVLQDLRFQIYPNPTTDFIYTLFENSDTEILELKILNARGQVVINKIVDKYITNPIQVTALPEGIYFMHLTDRKRRIFTLPFVISK